MRWAAPSTVDVRVNRAYGRMAGPNALAAKNRQLRELQDLRMAVYAVLESQHVAVNVRGVVTIEINGQKVPLPDYHPVLEAVDRLLDIQAQEAKLIGTYAPSRRSVEVLTKDALTQTMEQMTREMELLDEETWGPSQ